MKIIQYRQNLLDECAALWWNIYKDMPYVHRPDGCQTVNTSCIGPDYFVRHLQDGFEGAWYWPDGEVTEDSTFLAKDCGKVVGILVCSIDKDKDVGNVVSAYVPWDHRGRRIAVLLVDKALDHFARLGLHIAVAAPRPRGKSLEVENPTHLALLDAGFAWKDSWLQPSELGSEQWVVKGGETYGVFLGGSLEGFDVRPAIRRQIEQLRKEGVIIQRCGLDRFQDLRSAYPPEKLGGLGTLNCGLTFVALIGGQLVGWLGELQTFEDEGRMMGGAVPQVMPRYRRRGIGKVLYHLGMEEVVRRGAQYGWTATEIHNPARLIYRSIGYHYWYTAFSGMSKRLCP